MSVRGAMVLAALLASTACGESDLLGPDALQGIDAVVLLGPTCPVMPIDGSCPDQPYQAWIQVWSARGALVTRVRSDEEGHFRIGLRVGTYTLVPESGNPFPTASESVVSVEEGKYADVTITYDTGIR